MIKDFISFKFRHNFLLSKLIEQLRIVYNYDKVKLAGIENEIFIQQFQYAYKNSKFYNNLYKSMDISPDTIKTIEDIDKLPVIEKKMIKDKIDVLLTGNKKFAFKGYTSGTSGSPLTVYRDYKSILTENAYICYFRMRNGLNIKDRVINLRGSLLKGQLKHFDRASNTLYLSGYDINSANINFYYNEISNFQPKAIIGYPSSIHALAVEFEKKNYKLNIPLGFTSSENVYPHQAGKAFEVFGMRFNDWYGNSERNIALEQCGDHYHEVPLYSINEVHEDHIISTSLINKHFPLIRYKVEDQLRTIEDLADCKIHTQKFSSIDGRSSDYIKLKDGSIVNRLNQVFKSVENINYTQIIQNNLEEIIVNVVGTSNYNEENEKDIFNCLYSRTKDMIKIKIEKISEEGLIKTSSGKFRLVINNLKANENH